MPRQQVITNTWTCDGLDCPTPPSSASGNPFITVRVHKPGNDSISPVEIDLCPVCIETITSPVVVEAVNQMS